MTLEQVKRMRQWVIEQIFDHCLPCSVCQQSHPCAERERLLALLNHWSMLDIAMQEVERSER